MLYRGAKITYACLDDHPAIISRGSFGEAADAAGDMLDDASEEASDAMEIASDKVEEIKKG